MLLFFLLKQRSIPQTPAALRRLHGPQAVITDYILYATLIREKVKGTFTLKCVGKI